MGRVSNSESLAESKPIINHFSHPHPLQLFKFQPLQIRNQPSCSACNLVKPSEIIYACLTCNYYLHQTCSQMREKVTHQSHPHQLRVMLSPPYHNQLFSCDICKKTGSNQWLYRCDSCEFDAHLNCAITAQVASHQETAATQNPTPSLSAAEMFLNSYNNSMNANLAAIGMGTTASQENQLMNQMLQQASNGFSSYNTVLQGLLAAAGGVGSSSQLQGLMGHAGGVGIQSQLQGLTGGAGNPLEALMGGDVNVLSLIGGTGGAGTADLLQSLIGGGGAGADLFQSFLGGL